MKFDASSIQFRLKRLEQVFTQIAENVLDMLAIGIWVGQGWQGTRQVGSEVIKL